MAGLISALFGGKKRPETNPLPGVGGYDMPRGPTGEGGFPGSTSASPSVHPQTPDGRRDRQLTPEDAQNEWKYLPTRRINGTPRQPYARNKKQANDTYTPSTPIIGGNAPGSQNVRNSVAQKYKATPGQMREYLSSPNPAKNGGQTSGNTDNGVVIGGEPQPVVVNSRYVSPEGAQEGFAADRQIPYRIHERPGGYRGAPSVRGADLSGQRYTMAGKENVNQGGHGSFGIARKRGPLHRPVRFEMPGPWTANYRDEAPDEGSHQPNMVRRPSGGPTKTKPKTTRPNELEHRVTPQARGRTPRRPRRG